jgi:CDP-diacylglycerol--glycerol-3-phosphate 3-phosphatidyltransferase
MKNRIKNAARAVVHPLVRVLVALGVTPNALTLAGLVGSTVAAVLFAWGRFGWGAAALVLGSVCDMLDGAVARETGTSSRFGAFFDSTVDRLSELVVFVGFMAYYARVDGSILFASLAVLAAGGSFLVSYARARAEGLGIACSVGLMERPERLVLVVLGAILGPGAMKGVLVLLTVLVYYTVWQRIEHVRRELGTS